MVKKVVEYQIKGDTVHLEQALQAAIHHVDQLQTRLQTVATTPYMRGGKQADSYERAAEITKAVAQLDKLQAKFTSENLVNVTPDQLATLTELNKQLSKYIADTGNLNRVNAISKKSFEKMNAALRDMNYTLNQAGIAAENTSTSLSKLIVSAGRLLAKISIIKRVIQLFAKGYAVAADFVETMNLFNVAVGDASNELTGFVEKMSNAFSLDSEPLYRATAIFKQMAKTLGDASEASITFSKSATQLTYDLSSLYNVDVNTMISAFKSGLSGQTKPLMKYGISVHRATLEQIALSKGITKSYAAMNEAEKMYLRYIAIMEQAKSAQGDMAKTLESPANQMRILKDQTTLLIRNLGKLAIIVSKILMPAINGLLVSVNKMLSAFADAAGFEVIDYSDNLSENNQMLDEGTESINDYEDAINGLLAPLDEINQATATNDQLQIGQIDPSILAALETYDNLMDKVTSSTDKFSAIFSSVFNPEIFKGIGAMIGTAFDVITVAVTAVSDVLTALSPIINLVSTGVGYLLQGISWLIDKALKPLELWIKGVTSNIWTMIAAFAAFNAIQLLATGNAKAMIAVKAATWFATTAKQIAINTAALLKNAAAWIANTAKVIANTIANWWNNASLAAKIGLLTLGAGLVVVPIALAAAGVFSQKANETPKMARGGVVTGPTYALIGEGHYNEAVIPLGRSPQMQELKRDIADETSRKVSQPRRSIVQQGSDIQTPIILNIDGRELGRTSITNINKVKRQIGVDLA